MEDPLRLLPPQSIPAGYDPDDGHLVRIPRALVPIAGSLFRALEMRAAWSTDADWQQGQQIALLLQSRLAQEEEGVGKTFEGYVPEPGWWRVAYGEDGWTAGRIVVSTWRSSWHSFLDITSINLFTYNGLMVNAYRYFTTRNPMPLLRLRQSGFYGISHIEISFAVETHIRIWTEQVSYNGWIPCLDQNAGNDTILAEMTLT